MAIARGTLYEKETQDKLKETFSKYLENAKSICVIQEAKQVHSLSPFKEYELTRVVTIEILIKDGKSD